MIGLTQIATDTAAIVTAAGVVGIYRRVSSMASDVDQNNRALYGTRTSDGILSRFERVESTQEYIKDTQEHIMDQIEADDPEGQNA